MVVEEVYTNAFDARVVDWLETGASPYLNDSDANYIVAATDLINEGDWTFPNSAGSGAINSVKLRVELKGSKTEVGDVAVYVWDGTSWVLAGYATPTTSYAWIEIDVSAILNTWAKINGAEVYFQYLKTFTGSTVVRRLTRKVDYTEAVAAVEFQGDGLTGWS